MLFRSNVHRCIGSDGRHRPDRVAQVLAELRADVIGLQEVSTRSGDPADVDQVATFAEATGMHAMAGPTLVSTRGHCGNALLSRWPIRDVRTIDLSVARREPRAALDADLELGSDPLRVVVTHLGLRPGERSQQVGRLVQALADGPTSVPTVILADANEWRPLVHAVRRLRGFGFRAVPSFPAILPLLSLDLILTRPASALREVAAHRTPLARRASDHLPVRAVCDFRTEHSETRR